MSLEDINTLLKIIGGVFTALIVPAYKLWNHYAELREARVAKIEKDLNAAHAKIKLLEAPKCTAKICPLTKKEIA
jgi:hypothetical protein